MKLMMIIALFLCGCVSEWDGVPAVRVCTDPGWTGVQATCIADGKLYQCIRTRGRMLCTRDTVEIKCTNIVNVETVCPTKP